MAKKRRSKSALRKLPAADDLSRRLRSAEWSVERRSIELELDCLSYAIEHGLVDPLSGCWIGAYGALGLGADVLLALKLTRAVWAVAGDN